MFEKQLLVPFSTANGPRATISSNLASGSGVPGTSTNRTRYLTARRWPNSRSSLAPVERNTQPVLRNPRIRDGLGGLARGSPPRIHRSPSNGDQVGSPELRPRDDRARRTHAPRDARWLAAKGWVASMTASTPFCIRRSAESPSTPPNPPVRTRPANRRRPAGSTGEGCDHVEFRSRLEQPREAGRFAGTPEDEHSASHDCSDLATSRLGFAPCALIDAHSRPVRPAHQPALPIEHDDLDLGVAAQHRTGRGPAPPAPPEFGQGAGPAALAACQDLIRRVGSLDLACQGRGAPPSSRTHSQPVAPCRPGFAPSGGPCDPSRASRACRTRRRWSAAATDGVAGT